MKKNNFFKRMVQQANPAHVKEYMMSDKESEKAIGRGVKVARKMLKAITFGTPSSGSPVADVASGMFAIAMAKRLYEQQAQKAGIELDGVYSETERFLNDLDLEGWV